MEKTELILKLAWLGWDKGIDDLKSLFSWLKNFGIELKKHGTEHLLLFDGCPILRYEGLTENKIKTLVLPDILLLWKCERGELEGPSLENFSDPETDWT